MNRKRGPYFKYMRCDDSTLPAKVPRQTEWNRQNKVLHHINPNFDYLKNVLLLISRRTMLFRNWFLLCKARMRLDHLKSTSMNAK